MGTSTGLGRKTQAYLEDAKVIQVMKHTRDNALFITMSRIPFRVRNLESVEHSKRSNLAVDTHFTANPRGSRNSSEAPVSPVTVLIRTMAAHMSAIKSTYSWKATNQSQVS